MNKEEWEQVKSELQWVHGRVHLRIDGYDVDLVLEQISSYKNGIMLYVNGVFKYEWLMKECEERRRFFPCKKEKLFTPQKVAQMKKKMGLSKREIESFVKEHNRTYYNYGYYWNSFAKLKKHFIENNQSIELVKTGYL